MKIKIVIFICVCLISINTLAAEETSTQPIALSLPQLNWALKINSPGFTMENLEFAARGDAARFQAANKSTGIIMSGFLEKASTKSKADDCRTIYWSRAQKSPFLKTDIKMSGSGDMAIVEYLVKTYMGQDVNQKNVNAYLAKSDYCIDIHISKANYKSDDQREFNTVLKSVSIDENYKPNSLMLFQFGNTFYRQKRYSEAIPYYQQAYNLENNNRTMTKMLWFVLVDQLGMSYGVSGSIEKSKGVFITAISKESTYPMFYYNLACAYAESNDRDGAIKNLKLAYKYKSNMLPGEKLPDPRTDSSFKKYLNNNTFVEELNRLK
jgi:tetratricopeptide (TPR) repeat protein